MIFIKFNEALLVLNGKREFINLEDISKREDFNDVINNLYCPDIHCEARLTYNRSSIGSDFLKKHRSAVHNVECSYYSDVFKSVKSETEYIETNGQLTDEGKKRRIEEGVESLLQYLNLSEKPPKTPVHKPGPIKRTDEDTTKQVEIKVNYDPTGNVVKGNTEEGEVVREPSFYMRFPHQLRVSDSGKNLKVPVIINKVKVNNSNKIFGEINGFFENSEVTFILPEVFFEGNQRGLAKDQLIDYLNILGEYVEKKPKQLYLLTLCQSGEIDEKNLMLNVYEPDFMSFVTTSGKKIPSLSDVVIAIKTGRI